MTTKSDREYEQLRLSGLHAFYGESHCANRSPISPSRRAFLIDLRCYRKPNVLLKVRRLAGSRGGPGDRFWLVSKTIMDCFQDDFRHFNASFGRHEKIKKIYKITSFWEAIF